MQQLKKLYRKDYTGEEILLNTVYRNSVWEYEYETVPNRVTNIQISNAACIIGNGESRKDFRLDWHLKNHRSAGGRRNLQTYGCNALYRDFEPTFLVATGEQIIKELVDSHYPLNHIVYANSKSLLQHPGYFYLIPQDLYYNAGALATYLACFDGHKTVFLLGFDNGAGANINNNIYAGTNCYQPADYNWDDTYFIKVMELIMKTYDDVQFYRVMPNKEWRQPSEWLALPNYQQINFTEWSYMADL